MICDVILTQKNNKYIARIKNWPEFTAEENSRDEAVYQVKTQLTEYLADKTEIVQIEISLPAETDNPWLDKFGWFRDDPSFDDLQSEIAAYRKEIDQAMEQSAE
ncbi:MAG: hypothetical protein GY749_12750 [Desulfobacteraceae bacterium]|nr:hypothetical protein [Desulfobacteraceae bacterium]